MATASAALISAELSGIAPATEIGHALIDVPGAADCGATSLLRCCARTSRLKTVCVADGQRARKRSDAAIITLGLAARKALPRSRAAEKVIDSSTRRMDGYTFLLRTLRQIRLRDKDAWWFCR